LKQLQKYLKETQLNSKYSNMKDYFKTKIVNKAGAEWFLTRLHADGLLFHPEDRAEDIITCCPCPSEGGPDVYVPTFTPEEAKQLNDRMEEVYEVLDDPCQYILDEVYEDD
jgi:hypothetical protein